MVYVRQGHKLKAGREESDLRILYNLWDDNDCISLALAQFHPLTEPLKVPWYMDW